MEKIQVHTDFVTVEELMDTISSRCGMEQTTIVELINLAQQNLELIQKCYDELLSDEEFSEEVLQVYVSEDDYYVKLNGVGFIVEANGFTRALKLIIDYITK